LRLFVSWPCKNGARGVIGTREQLKIVNALIDQNALKEFQDEAKGAIKIVDALSEKRNKIAHAGWGIYNGESARFWHGLTSANLSEIVRNSPKGESLRAKNIHTISDIDAVADRCDTSFTHLFELYDKLQLSPWSERGENRVRLRALYENSGLEDPIDRHRRKAREQGQEENP
jgi:hypothetical protein